MSDREVILRKLENIKKVTRSKKLIAELASLIVSVEALNLSCDVCGGKGECIDCDGSGRCQTCDGSGKCCECE